MSIDTDSEWIKQLSDEIRELVNRFGYAPFRGAVVEWVGGLDFEPSDDLTKRRKQWVTDENAAGRTLNLAELGEQRQNGEPGPDGHVLEGVRIEGEHMYMWFPAEIGCGQLQEPIHLIKLASGLWDLNRAERLALLAAIHDRYQSGAEEIDPWNTDTPPKFDGSPYSATIGRIGDLLLDTDEDIKRYLRNLTERARGDLCELGPEELKCEAVLIPPTGPVVNGQRSSEATSSTPITPELSLKWPCPDYCSSTVGTMDANKVKEMRAEELNKLIRQRNSGFKKIVNWAISNFGDLPADHPDYICNWNDKETKKNGGDILKTMLAGDKDAPVLLDDDGSKGWRAIKARHKKLTAVKEAAREAVDGPLGEA